MKKELTTLFTGRHSTFLPEIDSTNTYLAGILRKISLPEGSVVRAGIQNAGRGQKGAIWESEKGKNLLLSFLFYPSFVAPKDVFLINKTFSSIVSRRNALRQINCIFRACFFTQSTKNTTQHIYLVFCCIFFFPV